jgi:hypothetical protein
MNLLTNPLLAESFVQATTKLQIFAQQPDFLAQLQVAFGDAFDTNIALGIAKQFQSGDFSLVPMLVSWMRFLCLQTFWQRIQVM